VAPTAQAYRVTYGRAGVHEWYAAGPLGIEQGSTVAQRPAGTADPLTLAWRLGGCSYGSVGIWTQQGPKLAASDETGTG
jgi:hypothetical protein